MVPEVKLVRLLLSLGFRLHVQHSSLSLATFRSAKALVFLAGIHGFLLYLYIAHGPASAELLGAPLATE